MYRFIWKIKLKDSVTDDVFIKFWHDSSMVLQEYDGAKGTLIHKARDEDRTYFLVAQWESQAIRDAMDKDTQEGISERAIRYSAFPKNETFGDIQAVFAGEQIGEAVLN